MKLTPIKHERTGLANTRFCEEREDGDIAIFLENTDTNSDGTVVAVIKPCQVADAVSFAETWGDLRAKKWFTPKMAAHFVNLVTELWLTKRRG
jgi:hypothetical protein